MSTVDNQLCIFKASPIVHEAAIRLNQIEWGKSMSLSDYIRREQTLLKSNTGQLTHASWVLMSTQDAQLWSSFDVDHVSNIMTQRNLTYSDIPILAACETYTRNAQFIIPHDNDNDTIHDIPLISIASVFVQPKLRGNNYASILLTKLYRTVLNQYSTTNKWIASLLYSDIGPDFYNKLGWQTYSSYSLVYRNNGIKNTITKPINANIKWMNQTDIQSLLNTIPCPPLIHSTTNRNKYQFRLPIQYDILDHFIRRSHHYYTLPIYKHQLDMPHHYGICLTDNTGCMLWNHLPEPNTLYILHYQATTITALHTLLQAAQYEAQIWGLNKIEAYLSGEQHDFITQTVQSLPNDWEIIERKDSLSSIRISHDQQDIKDLSNKLIWIGNERYCWV